MDDGQFLNLLIVERNPREVEEVRAALAETGSDWFELTHVPDSAQAVEALKAASFDAILLDWAQFGYSSQQLAQYREVAPAAAVVVMLGAHDTTVSIRAIRFGAEECVIKGQLRGRVLRSMLRTTVERHRVAVDLKSEMLRRQQTLERLSGVDELTGLINFRGFMERAHQEIQRSSRYGSKLSLAVLRINDYEKLTETFGETYSEHVLAVAATLVQNNIRQIDVVSRPAGAKFSLLLIETDLIQAKLVLERIVSRIGGHEFAPPAGSPLKLTANGGVVEWDATLKTPSSLLNAAEEALRQSRLAGPGLVVATPPAHS